VSPPSWDVIVVGAGIIGLASAVEISRRHPDKRILILDKEGQPGLHQSGHNSGVIHAGLYYRPGSLKAQTCGEGARSMVAFAEEHGIDYEICGKIVVATGPEEIPRLEELHRRGSANGIEGIKVLGPVQIKDIEPHTNGVKALWIPSTGIIDYPAVVRTYARIFEEAGQEMRLGAEVTGIVKGSGGITVETSVGDFSGKFLVNCAGLHADRVARLAGGRIPLRIIPFRGEYYELKAEKRSLVQGLIYPVPDPAFPFLGVHFTRRIEGTIEAGPNAVLAFKREGYAKTQMDPGDMFDTFSYPGFWRMAKKYWRVGAGEIVRSASKTAFTRALRKLMPDIGEDDLVPGGAGVRAQAVDMEGKLMDDFAIVHTEGAIHVCNAPSPGATASLMIGKKIADMAEEAYPALAGR
jgi:L-2-hydroxyglutarate oxidase LhgO